MSSSLSPIFSLFLIPSGVLYQKVQRLLAEDEAPEGSHPPVLQHRRPGPKRPIYGIPASEWPILPRFGGVGKCGIYYSIRGEQDGQATENLHTGVQTGFHPLLWRPETFELTHQLCRSNRCIGYLVYPFKNRHFEQRLIKEKRERMSSWQERISWTRDAVLERESPPELACRVLERGRASAKGGTERVGSAIEG